MTGLDTNVVVRFFIEDDPQQYQRAGRLLRSLSPQAPGFVSLVCLAEFVWVVRGVYRVRRELLLEWLKRILEAPELVIENQSVVEEAVEGFDEGGSDFADYLIERSGRLAGCDKTVSFDRRASKSAGMSLLTAR